jgi:hypothetical protein
VNKKKILIVSRSFYPMNSPRSFRTTELTKEFVRQGHEVTVITFRDNENHPEFEEKFGVTIKDLGKPRWKTVQLKGKGLKLLGRRLLRRALHLVLLYPEIELQRLVKNALLKESGYDLLISVAAPHPVHWGVAKARSRKHPIAKVWVADCGDPFMGLENDTFKPPFYFKFVEKWFCRKADYLTVPTQGAIEGYYPEFREKIKVIPQGFKFEEIKVSGEVVQNSVPTFAYAGGFIPGKRDPSEFLQFLTNLEQDFVFHIYTNTPGLVNPYLEKAKGRIFLHAYIPRPDLLYRLSQMDFVLNFENVGKKQTPSKLIDYAIVQKPILSIKTGDLNREYVYEFLSGDYGHQLFIDNPEQYRIENVSQRFLELTTPFQ